jgi:hypothetical protein
VLQYQQNTLLLHFKKTRESKEKIGGIFDGYFSYHDSMKIGQENKFLKDPHFVGLLLLIYNIYS